MSPTVLCPRTLAFALAAGAALPIAAQCTNVWLPGTGSAGMDPQVNAVAT